VDGGLGFSVDAVKNAKIAAFKQPRTQRKFTTGGKGLQKNEGDPPAQSEISGEKEGIFNGRK